ncbi:MAK10-like protein [Tanacetum coccineum]|uniref:MAK10-like protein n=1 Tax=Tanacetum coccineum TaxID=301880 RepID=A0ABQ5IEN0_9ASTR
MTRMMYNWIMRRKLDPRENSDRGVSNFTGRIKGMHVFVGNFTYVTDFMIVEDISSIIDPRLSQVVLGKPFIEISNMTHDPLEGVVRLVLEWEEKIKLHQEKEMEFDRWRNKNFKNKHHALVKIENEVDDDGEVTSNATTLCGGGRMDEGVYVTPTMVRSSTHPCRFSLFEKSTYLVHDAKTYHNYFNLFDFMVDSLNKALEVKGFLDLPLIVTETGWPCLDPRCIQTSAFVNGLICHLKTVDGTPSRNDGVSYVYLYQMFADVTRHMLEQGLLLTLFSDFDQDYTKTARQGGSKSKGYLNPAVHISLCLRCCFVASLNPLPEPAPTLMLSAANLLAYECQLAMIKMVGVHAALMHPQTQLPLKQTTGMSGTEASQAIYDGGFQNIAAAQQLIYRLELFVLSFRRLCVVFFLFLPFYLPSEYRSSPDWEIVVLFL